MRSAGSGPPWTRCLTAAVHEEAVDDEHIHAEDGQRREREARDREQRSDRAQAGAEDPDPAAVLASGPDRERGEELDHAEDQDDPAPGLQVLDDELRVVDEELSLVD